MKVVYGVIGLGLVGVLGLAVWYWQNLHETDQTVPRTALAQTINQCDLIASKAAAALPEALPFQKLEKAARQSRVLDRCMQDQGYRENPAWRPYALPIVRQMAAQQQVSEDEAYETLRRAAMLQAEKPDVVTYWRKRS